MRTVFPIEGIIKIAEKRRAGYVEAFLEAGHYDPETGLVEIDAEAFQALQEQFATPGLLQMAANATGAAARAAAAYVKGEEVLRNEEDQAECLAICLESGPGGAPCELFDAASLRCLHAKCGCYLNLKTRLATEHCPLPDPKW